MYLLVHQQGYIESSKVNDYQSLTTLKRDFITAIEIHKPTFLRKKLQAIHEYIVCIEIHVKGTSSLLSNSLISFYLLVLLASALG